ncbi:hypothetical protein, partial [Mesorhizobium sp.]|uniref:hypothetical protein n=1 Tax=Mesorhizobium sp. TaxID=1871066 RepID=UPI002580B998
SGAPSPTSPTEGAEAGDNSARSLGESGRESQRRDQRRTEVNLPERQCANAHSTISVMIGRPKGRRIH